MVKHNEFAGESSEGKEKGPEIPALYFLFV